MRRPERIGLWWVPLTLAFAPLVGLVPSHRDLIDYFAPMRTLTADLIGAGAAPWLNPANGCGEVWFANPQTAVLYPPAWLHLVLPGPWALAGEVAVHLALLSLGVGLIARDLGASRFGRTMVEVTAWSAGPILFTVGVLNNLETLTWIPWMVLASRMKGHGAVPLLAGATALGWLGGEPQLWAMGVVLAVAVARHRVRALAGVGLGTAIVSVQLAPFLVWVAEGDRGGSAAWLLRGAVAPAAWGGLVVPGPVASAGKMVYAESLFLGAPILMCALLGAWRRRWVLVVAGLLALLATLPEIGAGGLFTTLTGGLVRYPSRFALVAISMLLPAVGVGAEDWLEGRGRWLATVLALLALIVCAVSTHPWRWWVAGVPALLMLVAAATPKQKLLRASVLVVGTIAIVVAGVQLVDLRPIGVVYADTSTWPEAENGGRVYVPTPAEDVMRWLATGIEARRLWPVGYLNLDEGLTVARTDAPVAHRRLASHIAVTDEGPANRWWLDALAAEWMILPVGEGVPDSMEVVSSRGGMRLLRNQGALSVVSVGDGPPDPTLPWAPGGRVITLELDTTSCEATFETSTNAWLWISLTPVRGWRWKLDGRPVEPKQGPGIVQYLEVSPGGHDLEGRYRPPFHLVTSIFSGCALLAALFGLIRVRRMS